MMDDRGGAGRAEVQGCAVRAPSRLSGGRRRNQDMKVGSGSCSSSRTFIILRARVGNSPRQGEICMPGIDVSSAANPS